MSRPYIRLKSGDRLGLGDTGPEVWLSILESPISRDVERLVVLNWDEVRRVQGWLAARLAKHEETT